MSSAPARARTSRVPRGRLVLLVGAAAALLSGLNAAVLRLGLSAPVASDDLATAHGILMVYGFLGTAITLERAVALQSGRSRRLLLAYVAPAAAGLGTVLLLLGVAGVLPTGRLLPGAAWTVSMTALCGIYFVVWRRQTSYALLVQALGAFAGLAGIVVWTRGFEAAAIVPWWAALLVLTIVGERLELARVALAGSAVEQRVVAWSAGLLLTLVLTLFAPEWGYPALGLVLGVLVVELLVHDVARRTIRASGITRFMGACMLAGYGWALLAAGIWMTVGPVLSGFGYDAVVHSLTIGFVLSMILAHAPVIIPAVARRPLPYHPVMWAVLVLLQAGLLVRVVAGARAAEGAWQFGGAVTVTALLAFLVCTVTLLVIAGRRSRRAS